MNRLEFDEADGRNADAVAPGTDWLVLHNRTAMAVDAAALHARLHGAPWIGWIRTLEIDWDSQLTDVSILAAFPALRSLFVHGARIATLDGIEDFRGDLIDIDTGRNKKRRLDALAQAQATRLVLLWGRPDDLEAIGRCASLREVTLGRAPEIDLSLWTNLGLERLSLNSCSFKVLADTARVATLRSLSIIKCRKFERFAGDCSNIQRAWVDASQATDIDTIGALSGVEDLILSFVRGAPLSTFLQLKKLRTARFWSSELDMDVRGIKSALPRLEEFDYPKLSPAEAIALSAENRGLVVTSGNQRFRDGRPVAG